MRRALIFLSCLAAGAGGASALAAGTADSPRAELMQFTCVTALDPVDRSLSVKAEMYPLPGGSRLALLPVLLRQGARGRVPHDVSGGALGHLIRPSDPALGAHPDDRWIVNLPVVDLPAPARYRLQVSFRWLDAHGRILAERTERTPACYQPELRPDLEVSAVRESTVASGASREAYVVHIRNIGATAARAFMVDFAQSKNVIEQSVPGLARHAATVVRFQAARCDPATPPRILVDPQAQVDDADRSNNSRTIVCR